MSTPSSNKAAIVRTLVVVALLAAMAWIAKKFLLDGGDPMPPPKATPAPAAAPQ